MRALIALVLLLLGWLSHPLLAQKLAPDAVHGTVEYFAKGVWEPVLAGRSYPGKMRIRVGQGSFVRFQNKKPKAIWNPGEYEIYYRDDLVLDNPLSPETAGNEGAWYVLANRDGAVELYREGQWIALPKMAEVPKNSLLKKTDAEPVFLFAAGSTISKLLMGRQLYPTVNLAADDAYMAKGYPLDQEEKVVATLVKPITKGASLTTRETPTAASQPITTPKSGPARANLYVLAVGVSKFQDESLNLNFCDDDAEALSAAFKRMSGKIFGQVEARVFTNEQAKLVNLKRGVSWLRENATSQDVAIVHLASHGAMDNTGSFYIIPHDYEGDLFASALPVKEIIEAIRQVNCKLIVLLDACHSGASGQNLLKWGEQRSTATMEAVAGQIARAEGGLTLVVSSSGKEYSLERADWGHGAFTKAILEGLNGAADYDGDKVISLTEINLHITRRVKDLTAGKQHPFIPIAQSGDLPLYVLE